MPENRQPNNVLFPEDDVLQMGIHIWDEIAKGISQKMPQELIPAVNEIFHKTYPPNARITFLATEYIKPQPKDGHPYPLILSDITFQIDGDEIYHLEFQVSEDKTMSIRMSEYDFQIGLQHSSFLSGDSSRMTVQLPYSAVIYPVAGKNAPDTLICELIFQDQSVHTYQVPIVKISDYQLHELLQKHLNIFLPFSLLRFRSKVNQLTKLRIKEAADDNTIAAADDMEEMILKELTPFIDQLILGLEDETNQGILSQWQYHEYLRVIDIAAAQLLHRHRKLWKEVHHMTECKLKFISDIVHDYENVIAEKDDVIAEKDDVIAEKDDVIAEKDDVIAEKDARIAMLEQQLAQLQS